MKNNASVEFRRVKTKTIKPYANNPRENTVVVEYVKSSIQEFGFRRPIVVDEELTILAGHTRLMALEQLGIDEVMVAIVSGLTEAQKTAYRIKDNRAGELTLFDFDEVAEEILQFADAGIDMSRFGFEPPRVEPPDADDVAMEVGVLPATGTVVCPRCGKVVE